MLRESDSRRYSGWALPQPRQLAALGAVLCLYRVQQGAALAGWMRAVRAESSAGLDSDGLRESLWFHDSDGRNCWRLYLLPDSDFLAWQQLSQTLPMRVEQDSGSGLCQRLWRRVADHLRGDSWCACVLRLHALHVMAGVGTASQPLLAASLVPLSELGTAAVGRIARAEGVDGAIFVAGERRMHAAELASDRPCHASPALFYGRNSGELT